MARFERLEFDRGARRANRSDRRRRSTESDQEEWMRKADDHRRRGLYENSLRYYSRALELDRSLLAGWVGQVQMLVLLGEYPEAELWARKALELFKGQGDLMAGRAQALARHRRPHDRRWSSPTPRSGRRGARPTAGWSAASCCSRPATSVDQPLLRQGRPGRPRLARAPGDRTDLPALRAAEQGRSSAPARPSRRRPDSFYAWFVQGRCEQALGLRPARRRSATSAAWSCRRATSRRSRKLAELDNQGWSLSQGLRRLIGR